MFHKTIFVLCAYSFVAESTFAGEHLGICEHAIALATTHSCLTELGYAHETSKRKHVSAKLEAVAESWMRSDLRREAQRLERDARRRSVKEEFGFFRNKSRRVEEINSLILDDIAKSLGDTKAFERFKEMLVQDSARKGSLGDVVRLLELDMDVDRFRLLDERLDDLSEKANINEKRLRYEAAAELIVQSGIATKKELSEASGPLWLEVRGEPIVHNTMQARLFHPYVLQLIASPQVAAHLEFTPPVVADLQEVKETFSTKYGEKRLVELLTSTKDITAVRKEIGKWFADINGAISKVIDDEETNDRLRQVVFQEHLAALQFGPVLRLLEKEEPGRELIAASSTIFASAFYEKEVAKTHQVRALLLEIFPGNARRIESAFLRIYIPNSPWDTIYNITEHEKLRAAAIERGRLKGQEPKVNVRRR